MPTLPAPSIRSLTPEDAEAYVALRHEMITREPWAFLGKPGNDVASDPDHVRRQLSNANFAIFGASANAAAPLLAVATVMRSARQKTRHRASIMGVYTTPSARGLGLGRGIVQACVNHARSWEGVSAVSLSASARSVTAIRLYESLGFVSWGIEPHAVRIDGVCESEVHLQLAL